MSYMSISVVSVLEVVIPLLATSILLILVLIRSRRVSRALQKPFRLLLAAASSLWIGLILITALLVVAFLGYFDETKAPIRQLSIFQDLLLDLASVLILASLLSTTTSLGRSTGCSPGRAAVLPLKILIGLFFAVLLVLFIWSEVLLQTDGLTVPPPWAYLDAAFRYVHFLAAVYAAVLAVRTSRAARRGLMFTSHEAGAIKGVSGRLSVAAGSFVVPWLWSTTSVTLDFVGYGIVGSVPWTMVTAIVFLWPMVIVMVLLYTAGKWDLPEPVGGGVAGKEGGRFKLNGWRRPASPEAVQV